MTAAPQDARREKLEPDNEGGTVVKVACPYPFSPCRCGTCATRENGGIGYYVAQLAPGEVARLRALFAAPLAAPPAVAPTEGDVLHDEVTAAMARSNGRFCEWGERAQMVEQMVDEALAKYRATRFPAPPRPTNTEAE